MNSAACWRPVAFRRRLLLIFLVAAQTLAGVYLFAQTVPEQANGGTTATLLAVFGLLFAWIGVGFWTAVFGFVALRFGGDPWSLSSRVGQPESEEATLAPTAVVMPVCNEPVQRTLGGLKAIIRDLERTGQQESVDFYVLSDSRDPEIWLEEQATCEQIRRELGPGQQLFYRRRNINLNYKSGNIADFLRRWGRRYRYVVVLDADSLLSANCITRLIQLMEARPEAGIIQTTPRLARAETRFGRLQQFANRCYGRLYSAGLAAIQLGEATYWGHNAIIRVAPFMAHCGLRKLRGPGLFRGPVLSHDFIEAALMGRAGYEVWLEPAIAGSFEESPPTLEDDLIRDRRWCRGNLQHLWLLATLGKIRLAHRMALVTGIFSYLASPLWLVFLGLSGYVALADSTPALPGVMATTDTGSGPGFLLVLVTSVLLFGPRLLAIADHSLAKRTTRFGGLLRLSGNTLMETLAALALADSTPALPGVMATTDTGSGPGFLLVLVTSVLLFGPHPDVDSHLPCWGRAVESQSRLAGTEPVRRCQAGAQPSALCPPAGFRRCGAQPDPMARAVADTLGPARIGTGIVFTCSGLVAEPKTGRRAVVGGARRLPDNDGD